MKFFFLKLVELLDELYCPSKFFIVGDFNFHFDDPKDNDAVQELNGYCLNAHVNGITRLGRGQQSDSQLDNVLSNIENENVSAEIYESDII